MNNVEVQPAVLCSTDAKEATEAPEVLSVGRGSLSGRIADGIISVFKERKCLPSATCWAIARALTLLLAMACGPLADFCNCFADLLPIFGPGTREK